MHEETLIEGGQRRQVLLIVSSSMATVARFRAVATDGQPVEGKFEVRRGLFGQTREEFPLRLDNAARKGFWDAIFAVYVIPDRQTRIMFQTRHFRAQHLAMLLAAVLILGTASGLVAYFAKGG